MAMPTQKVTILSTKLPICKQTQASHHWQRLRDEAKQAC